MRPLLLLLPLLASLLSPPAARADAPLLGVSFPSVRALEEELPRLRSLGATVARATLPWREFEPRPGRFDLAPVRRAVEGARAQGMTTILVLRAIHPDATRHRQRPRKTRGVSTAPLRFAQYAASAGALAASLAGCGVAYEIEDEPLDGASWWSGRRDYLRLLETCYPAIKAADPGAVVLCAAMPCGASRDEVSRRDRFEYIRRNAKYLRMAAGAWNTFRTGDPASFVPPLPLPTPAGLHALLRPRFNREWSFRLHDEWCREIYRTGCFDAVAAHDEYLPGEQDIDGVTFAAYLQHLRRLMREEGADRPLWITSVSFPSVPAFLLDAARPEDPGSPDLQEEWLREAFLQAAALRVGAFVWADLRDPPDGRHPPTGLFAPDGRARPAHETFRFLCGNAGRFTPADPPGIPDVR